MNSALIPGVSGRWTEIIMNIKSLAIKNNSETNEPKTALYRIMRAKVLSGLQIFRQTRILRLLIPTW